jgi:transcriptional regulator with XRE-family HTH domain
MNTLRLGLMLSKRRKEAGLTQDELARRIGTSQGAISRLEAGSVLPTLAVLERFAAATGGPLTITVGETAPPDRDERRRRVERVLGPDPFNPWDRDPSPVERAGLLADGLTRERFEG